MALRAEFVTATAPASSGSSNVTISGFGTPQAILVYGTNGSANGPTTDALVNVGAWDGTNQWGVSTWSEDAGSSTNCATYYNTTGIVDDAENSGGYIARITGTVTDGVTVSWAGNALGRRFVFVFFSGADDVTAWTEALGAGTSSFTKTFSHNNDFTFLFHSSYAVTYAAFSISANLVHYDGSTLHKYGAGMDQKDASSTAANVIDIDDDTIASALYAGSEYATLTCTRPLSTRIAVSGFTDGEGEFYGLTFELADQDEVAIGNYSVTSATTPFDDSTQIDAGGWRPGFLGLINTRCEQADGAETGANSSAMGFGFANSPSDQFSIAWRSEDAASTIESDSYQNDTACVRLMDHGSTTRTVEGELKSFDSDGFTLTWETVLPGTRYGLYWAVKSSAVTVTGTGALTSQDAAISGTGTVVPVITGTGALASQSAAISGTGEVTTVVTGTGSLTVQDASIVGAGVIGRVGTGSLEVQVATIAGTGVRAIIGTGVLTPAACAMSGAGVRTVTGSGALLSSSSYLAGVGAKEINSTAVLVAQSAAIDAVGFVSSALVGTGALVSQPSTIAASGAVGRLGTGVLTAQSATVTGSGVIGRIGTGALTAQSSAISGVGFFPVTITGTGALRAKSSQISASGRLLSWSNKPDVSSGWKDVAETGSIWTDKTDSENTWNT